MPPIAKYIKTFVSNDRPSILILHKTEWDRLQEQGGSSFEEPVNVQREYLKALTEQSQEWMKTWPDSVASHLAKIEKQKKQQQKSNLEFIRAYKEAENKAKKGNTAKAIKEARQLIFEGSNYGRKLLSALLESKAIEVRDAQIKFNNDAKKKAAELAKEEVSTRGDSYFRDKSAERKKQAKLKILECIRTNKEIVLMKKEKELREKIIEKQCAIEAEILMKQVVEIEKKEKEDIKRCEKQKLDEYEADKKELAKIKERDQKLNDALIEAQKNERDRIELKTRAVLRKVCLGRPDTKWSKDLYKKIKHIQSKENKRYEDFVNKGVKDYEQRNFKKEISNLLQEKQKCSDKYLISQRNKIAGQEIMQAKNCENKCTCDRQSLIMKVTAKTVKKTETKSSDHSSTSYEYMKKKPDKVCDRKAKKPSFLAPRNFLTEELRQRKNEPSSWSAAEGAHAQFAQQADSVLKEIKHKHFARKVVDEYRKFNCLDATTLPVPNY